MLANRSLGIWSIIDLTSFKFQQLHKRQSELVRNAKYTLRRCYSRVKEHGVGKRKSSYTFEQLEQVFGQGGWDSQPCQPVLINSSGLYQELESDGSTMEEYSQEDWGNHSQDLHCYQTGEQELGKKSHLGASPSSDFTCAHTYLTRTYLSTNFHVSDITCSGC